MTNQPNPETQSFRLTIGGDVQANNGSYLRRSSDDALLNACLNRDFAYVLACRQIGKSSLKNAVAEELIEHGVQVARVDLNRIGQNVTAQQWYYSLLADIARNLGLKAEFEPWWESQSDLSTHAQRFLNFFDQLVLPQNDDSVVIFLDEIDVTLGLDFTDDLFAAIRSVYNDRSQHDAYHRLSFVLLGVATPDDLINDSMRTPFNVGQPISIRDFAKDEIADTFIELLEMQHSNRGMSHFDQIFAWTNGHPYLTQRLTQAVIDSEDSPPNLVDHQVSDIFLTEGERLEINLHTVQTRVLSDEHVVGMMRIHSRLLDGKDVADAQKSPAINRLKLYGLVLAENGLLRIRNRIYREVFDREWNQKHFPINWSKRVAVASISVLVALLLFGAGIFAHNNLWLPSIASQLDSKYSEAEEAGDVHGQCVAMAGLYQLDERIIGPSSRYYASKAERLLARLNADETIALFDPPTNPCHATLIEQFYTELADTELLASNQPTGNDRLLQAMATSQSWAVEANATPVAHIELEAWANARNGVRKGAYQNSVNAYSTAITANSSNPSLFFERSVLLLQMDRLNGALSDLSQAQKLLDLTIGISPTPTPTSTPISTSTPIPTPTLIEIITSTSINATTTPIGITQEPLVVENTNIPALEIVSTVQTLGIIERVPPNRLFNAVRRLLLEHPKFNNITTADLEPYPTLASLGLGSRMAVVAAVTPTAINTFAVAPDATDTTIPPTQTDTPTPNNTSYACNQDNTLPLTECDALVSLYASTNGTNWITRTNWLETDDPCNWYGVTCEDGSVTKLDLNSNNLTGTIPEGISQLANLDQLFLHINKLTGNVPNSLGNLTKLFQLGLNKNLLDGNIPSTLGSLSNLTYLALNENNLTGPIPPELGNLSRLQTLALHDNELAGSIPSSLGNLQNAFNIILYRNNLTGDIPHELGNLDQLRVLELQGNQLTGGIPPELGQIRTLIVLSLMSNRLIGEIPPELGNLRNLTHLQLSDNNLSGLIPVGLWEIRDRLVELRLNDNPQLTGELPLELMQWSLNFLQYQNTNVCESADTEFQIWLRTINYWESSGILCTQNSTPIPPMIEPLGLWVWAGNRPPMPEVAISGQVVVAYGDIDNSGTCHFKRFEEGVAVIGLGDGTFQIVRITGTPDQIDEAIEDIKQNAGLDSNTCSEIE